MVFVNGFTDAPNAIVNCVATGCLSLRKAAYMAACFNLAGAAAGFAVTKSVAYTISGLVSFNASPQTDIAVSAALASIIIWAVAAWKYGIPTSESHALAAGLAGAVLACGGGVGFGAYEWLKLFAGLIFSVSGGYLLGAFSGAVLKKCNFTEKTYKRSQITAAAATAFMHGAQDGQKFLGLYLLLSHGDCPFCIPLICGLLMAFGTRFGGRRIIENVGVKMVSMEKYQGVAADMASSVCLLCFTVAGIPVSTTHTKTAAIMGSAHDGINKKIARGIGAAWLFTFPCCAAISYILTLILISIK